MWLGFVISVLFLIAAVGLVLADHEAADIVGLAAVFVVGRVNQARERVQKAKLLGG